MKNLQFSDPQNLLLPSVGKILEIFERIEDKFLEVYLGSLRDTLEKFSGHLEEFFGDALKIIRVYFNEYPEKNGKVRYANSDKFYSR